jgi:hypothetical protein
MSSAYRRARSTSARFARPKWPMASEVRSAFGRVNTLSQLTTLASGSPSSGPTSTSERIPRIVRVIGAQVTAETTLIAASLVSTQTGRRPAGGPSSAQKMSPLATTEEQSQRRDERRLRLIQDLEVPVGRRPVARDPLDEGRRPPAPRELRAAVARSGSFRGWSLSDPAVRRGRRPAEPALLV